MVKDLFAANGAAQDTAIFRFATDVDADQRAEITRMRALLETRSDSSSSFPTPNPPPMIFRLSFRWCHAGGNRPCSANMNCPERQGTILWPTFRTGP